MVFGQFIVFCKTKHFSLILRTNATHEENMQAIRDDAAAFGLGSLAGALAELLLIAIAVNILNRVALNQVKFLFFSQGWFDF